MGNLLGPSIASGNHVTTLLNGDQIFPSMLAAIRGARQSITFETYIYWSGTIGKEFADALSERVRAGDKVHVLVDWVGSIKMDQELLKGTSKNPNSVAIRRCSQKIAPYISIICGVAIFCSRLVSLRILNF